MGGDGVGSGRVGPLHRERTERQIHEAVSSTEGPGPHGVTDGGGRRRLHVTTNTQVER